MNGLVTNKNRPAISYFQSNRIHQSINQASFVLFIFETEEISNIGPGAESIGIQKEGHNRSDKRQ